MVISQVYAFKYIEQHTEKERVQPFFFRLLHTVFRRTKGSRVSVREVLRSDSSPL